LTFSFRVADPRGIRIGANYRSLAAGTPAGELVLAQAELVVWIDLARSDRPAPDDEGCAVAPAQPTRELVH